MTSLSEVYQGGRGGPSLRRLYLGVGLFAVGVLLLVAALLITATDLFIGTEWILETEGQNGMGLYEARRVGGVLGGIGLPAVFLGVATVLPASRSTRAAAVIGAAVAMFGVGLFWHAYPCQWIGANCGPEYGDLTIETTGIYFIGTLTTFWCLFVGVANFKTRNDPGGTVELETVRKGETKVVEIERPSFGLGGIGFLGGTPDGDVETQTNRPGTGAAGTGSRSGTGIGRGAGTETGTGGSVGAPGAEPTGPGSAAVGDGGESDDPLTSPLDAAETRGRAGGAGDGAAPGEAVIGRERLDDAADRYCGNCAQFRYVRTDSGIQPYCGHYDDLMDDMDACDEWSSRR